MPSKCGTPPAFSTAVPVAAVGDDAAREVAALGGGVSRLQERHVLFRREAAVGFVNDEPVLDVVAVVGDCGLDEPLPCGAGKGNGLVPDGVGAVLRDASPLGNVRGAGDLEVGDDLHAVLAGERHAVVPPDEPARFRFHGRPLLEESVSATEGGGAPDAGAGHDFDGIGDEGDVRADVAFHLLRRRRDDAEDVLLQGQRDRSGADLRLPLDEQAKAAGPSLQDGFGAPLRGAGGQGPVLDGAFGNGLVEVTDDAPAQRGRCGGDSVVAREEIKADGFVAVEDLARFLPVETELDRRGGNEGVGRRGGEREGVNPEGGGARGLGVDAHVVAARVGGGLEGNGNRLPFVADSGAELADAGARAVGCFAGERDGDGDVGLERAPEDVLRVRLELHYAVDHAEGGGRAGDVGVAIERQAQTALAVGGRVRGPVVRADGMEALVERGPFVGGDAGLERAVADPVCRLGYGGRRAVAGHLPLDEFGVNLDLLAGTIHAKVGGHGGEVERVNPEPFVGAAEGDGEGLEGLGGFDDNGAGGALAAFELKCRDAPAELDFNVKGWALRIGQKKGGQPDQIPAGWELAFKGRNDAPARLGGVVRGEGAGHNAAGVALSVGYDGVALAFNGHVLGLDEPAVGGRGGGRKGEGAEQRHGGQEYSGMAGHGEGYPVAMSKYAKTGCRHDIRAD